MTRYKKIKEALENMDTDEIVVVHNAYCKNNRHMDDYIYSMEDFDEIMRGVAPWEVARAALYGHFRPDDDYFRFVAFANVESFDCWKERTCGIYPNDIAQYVDDNGDDLGNEKIAEILEQED